MKQLSIILFLLILIGCNAKSSNENTGNESEFLSVFEMTALDSNGVAIDFNISFSAIYNKESIQNCGLKNKDDVNDALVTPTVLSIIRQEISLISREKISQISKEFLKEKINNQLESDEIIFNGKQTVNCNVSVRLFSITERK